MNELFTQMLGFIGSNTMREYLSTLYEQGKFSPSAEDMLAIVYNSDKSLSDRFSFIKLLSEHITNKEAFKQLCDAAVLLQSDFAENDLHLYTNEDIFNDDDELIGSKELTFSSVEEAMSYSNNIDNGSMCCKLMSGESVLIDQIIIGKDDIHYFFTSHCDDEQALLTDELNAADKMTNKYVYIPTPFEPGDTVCLYDDPNQKFIIINAEPDDPAKWGDMLDYIDVSVMVVPYSIKEHATPEKIKEHYARLTEGCVKGNGVAADKISLHHDHIDPLYLELVEKASK